jgi:hypothetical protein
MVASGEYEHSLLRVTSSEVTHLDLFVQLCPLKPTALPLVSDVLDAVSESTDLESEV